MQITMESKKAELEIETLQTSELRKRVLKKRIELRYSHLPDKRKTGRKSNLTYPEHFEEEK